MIYIQNRRSSLEKIKIKFPYAEIVDVTSKAPQPWVKFSPFYAHGGIPVPFSEGEYSQSVEGIWQGLKTFEGVGIDKASFRNDKMKGLKRTQRKFGRIVGHRKGTLGTDILGYIEARKAIYLPAYTWMLDNKVSFLTQKLADIAAKKDLVLLDYETNTDIDNPTKPLSHAALLRTRIRELLNVIQD